MERPILSSEVVISIFMSMSLSPVFTETGSYVLFNCGWIGTRNFLHVHWKPSVQRLGCMGTTPCSSTNFTKGTNFSDFLFASLEDVALIIYCTQNGQNSIEFWPF